MWVPILRMSSKRTEILVEAKVFGRIVCILLGYNTSAHVPAYVWRVSVDGSPSDGSHYLHNSCLAKYADRTAEYISVGVERHHRSMDLTETRPGVA